MDVSVVIGTFGSDEWIETAQRAAASAESQGPVIQAHGATLAQARNIGAAQAKTEWLCFLDADDELAPGYFDAMERGSADLRAPAVSYVRGGPRRAPYVPRVAGHTHACVAECLREGNWLVVGTLIRRASFCEVGGFREWAVYEDWDLFLRCWLVGATVEAIPEAIYVAHVRPDSRNRAPSMAEKNRVHWQIVEANGLAVGA